MGARTPWLLSRRSALALATGLTAAPRVHAYPGAANRYWGRRGSPLGPVRAVYVPMRDGVRIALDVVVPADIQPGERLPAVLSMTRYWRAEQGSGPSDVASLYTPLGFVAVVGDVRGTGASFGVWTHHRSRAETLDLGEIIDWIAVQPWSDGRVVGVGNSYAGNTADWMAAERRPPALAAIVPRFPDYDPYADLYFPGGAPNAFMGRTWGAAVKMQDLNRMPGHRHGPGASLGVRRVDADTDGRLLKAALAARAEAPSVWEGLKTITFRDDRPPAWQGESLDDIGIHSHARAVEAGGTPIQTWAGWMDAGTANGAIHRFMTLSNPMRAYVGAWSHGGAHDASPYQPDDAPPNPSFDLQQQADLAFIDRCLASAAQHPQGRLLHYFTLGEERWKTTEVWPPRGVRLRPAYLAAGDRLGEAPPTAGAADRYRVDFTATTGKKNRWATNAGGADVVYGDRAAADRKCRCYTSPPLVHGMEITGHPIAELWISADRDDCALFVYLEDVAPDGRVRYLTEGQFRALHRRVSDSRPPYWSAGPYHSFRRADALPLVPGQPALLAFALMPISVRLAAGHRLRIAIAGADADTFTRIPAAGELELSLHRRPGAASRVLLPVA
jgi:putative CocE/NonD family hydrolase